MSNEVEGMQIDQSADLPQYERAEVKALPTKKFVCVEYPGNVKNVDKAVDTLGGMSSIQRVSTWICCERNRILNANHQIAFKIFL